MIKVLQTVWSDHLPQILESIISKINSMMHNAWKCDCTTRALAAFLKDVTGIGIQSRNTRPLLQRRINHASAVRSFSTEKRLNDTPCTLLTQSASNVDSASDGAGMRTIDAARLPSPDGALLDHETRFPRLNILFPAKSRLQSRLERKERRQAAKNAEAEQAALEAEKLKRRLRRERKRRDALESTQAGEATIKPSMTATGDMKTASIADDAADSWSKAAGLVKAKGKTSKPAVTSSAAAKVSMKKDKALVPSKNGKAHESSKKKKKASEVPKIASTASPVASRVASDEGEKDRSSIEDWQIQKAALQAKFKDQAWNPRKRISPDALAGIRTMHAQQPDVFTTEVLASHFKVSPEAVRRILKSKWQPGEEEAADRRRRWEKRGARKWEEMVELGIRPPKRWREMGIGRVGRGEKPTWKRGGKAGERWIEQAESEHFIMAGDMAIEQSAGLGPGDGSDGLSLGDRIV